MPLATSIFAGGGTPSRVEAAGLVGVIGSIPVARPVEITVECNPDDVTEELLMGYSEGGITRISLGVQSVVPHVLASLGRTHDPEAVHRAVELVKRFGFQSFSVDLIMGAAEESIADWQATIEAVLGLSPPHISAYGLQVEPGTPLAADPRRHPNDDDQAAKYVLLDDRLRAAGLANYEISNWALPGHESRHNQLYWQQYNYRGFGAAAHSHWDGRRWWNLRTPDRYVDAVQRGISTEAAGEQLDEETRLFERYELALRTRTGVPVSVLDGEALDDLVERVSGADGDRWVLTQRGRLLANEVAVKLEPRGVAG